MPSSPPMALSLFVLVASGCYASHGVPSTDAGSPSDTGTPTDAGPADGRPDTAEPRDSSMPSTEPDGRFVLSSSGAFVLWDEGDFSSAGDVSGGVAGRWGQLGFPRSPPPEHGFARYEGMFRFSELAAAQLATCAVNLRVGRSLYCWGTNAYGLLGIDRSDPTRVELEPISVPISGSGAQIIEAGDRHFCVLDGNAELWCWGANDHGQLGADSDRDHHSRPTRVLGRFGWREVSSSYDHTCAIRADGALFCWGRGEDGQLGEGSTVSRAAPVQVGTATDWLSVSAGVAHTCGFRGRADAPRLFCWGRNLSGEAGPPAGMPVLEPRAIEGTGWSGVSCGEYHTCVMRSDGGRRGVYCFGDNTMGELGLPGVAASDTPLPVPAPFDFASVVASWRYTCAVTVAGAHYCWGSPSAARFAPPTTPEGTVDRPVEVSFTP